MLYLKEDSQRIKWGIWKIEETKEELLSFLEEISILEKDVLSLTAQSKLLERLAVRVLLKELLGKEGEISYFESGKPYLKNEDFHISLSHTKGYVAVVLSKEKYAGIDIQYITGKVKNIKSRFIDESEYIDPENEIIHLLLHWSAKETLYKALGEGVNLKEHFYVQPFQPVVEDTILARENITGDNEIFRIAYKVTHDFVLTYIK